MPEIGRVPADHELSLVSDAARPIPVGGRVPLAVNGVEHIRSRESAPRLITIRVNSRKRQVQPGTISFEELIKLAFETPPAGPNVAFTVSSRKGPPPRPEGSLPPGQYVHALEGRVFQVTPIHKSLYRYLDTY